MMVSILVVCTGNVCRSPYVERRLQAELGERVRVESAGTGALVGAPVDEGVVRLLDGAGTSWQGHEARQLTPEMMAEADLVLTAAREHRAAAVALYPKALRYTFTLRDFAHFGASLEDELNGVTDRAERIRQASGAAVQIRTRVRPLEAAEADIVDPFRRRRDVYGSMAQQVEDALPGALRILRG